MTTLLIVYKAKRRKADASEPFVEKGNPRNSVGGKDSGISEICRIFKPEVHHNISIKNCPFLPDNEKNRITLNRESNEHTRRLKRSLNKVKWSQALMQIFWTAGPVTTLGLIGGYYIGYGTMPSIQLLIYFVSFTIFSGVIGLLAKVVYDGTRGHLEEQNEKDVQRVTGKLADLILIARDKVVQTYEGEARQREAALQLLRRVDLSPYGVTIAFKDLTGNREIGEIMGQIFAYRRIGLQTKVHELYSAHRDLIEESASSIEKQSPQAARELKQWFTGNTSGRLKYGVPREKYFLQRVMSAIENNSPYIMTFRDVEEMMILAFELINGREIPTLIFTYSGRWKYAKRLDDLEKKRSRYRVAQARGGNRIRALAAYLVETGITSYDELPEGLEINELVKKVSRVIDRLTLQMRKAARDQNLSIRETKRLADVLENCIELYQMANEGYRESRKRYKELSEVLEEWETFSKKSSVSNEIIGSKRGKKGIRIKESVISLNEEAKIDVCRHLSWYFQKEDIKTRSYSLFSSFNNKGAMSARRLAIEIAVALEPHIKLSRPEIQRNINATRAIYLGELSPDMSDIQKQELGVKMAKVADNGLGIAAIRLAEVLVWQYQVDLSDEAIEFLRYNYGAGRRTLERIAKQKKGDVRRNGQSPDIPPRPAPPKKVWGQTLQSVRKSVAKRQT